MPSECIRIIKYEQKLDLRRNVQLGVGNYLAPTNTMYWELNLDLTGI